MFTLFKKYADIIFEILILNFAKLKLRFIQETSEVYNEVRYQAISAYLDRLLFDNFSPDLLINCLRVFKFLVFELFFDVSIYIAADATNLILISEPVDEITITYVYNLFTEQ